MRNLFCFVVIVLSLAACKTNGAWNEPGKRNFPLVSGKENGESIGFEKVKTEVAQATTDFSTEIETVLQRIDGGQAVLAPYGSVSYDGADESENLNKALEKFSSTLKNLQSKEKLVEKVYETVKLTEKIFAESISEKGDSFFGQIARATRLQLIDSLTIAICIETAMSALATKANRVCNTVRVVQQMKERDLTPNPDVILAVRNELTAMKTLVESLRIAR